MQGEHCNMDALTRNMRRHAAAGGIAALAVRQLKAWILADAKAFGKLLALNREAYSATGMVKRQFKLMTKQNYVQMRDSQRNVCAICGQPNARALAIDHCHASGRVRELLCDRCNSGLGQFKDDPDVLRKAAAYIEKHRQ